MRKFIVLPLLVLLAACTDRGPIGPDEQEGAEFLAKKGDNPGKGGGGKPQPPADPEIAYVDRGGGSARLFVMNADGTRQTKVFGASYLANPSWSGLGMGTTGDPYRIVFRKDSKTWRDPDNHISLWVTDVVISSAGESVGENPRLITQPDRCGNRRGTGTCWPAWSPDGDWIAVAEGFTSGTSHLWRIPAAGCLVWAECATELYSSFGHVLSPAWSPESDRIAVFVNPPGPANSFIAIVHLPPSTAVVTIALMDLDPPLDWVFDIDWARSGDVLALDALLLSESGRRVLTLDLTTGTVTEVVEGLEPTWSPDDMKLAFAKRGITVVDLATGDLERLAKGREPDWRR